MTGAWAGKFDTIGSGDDQRISVFSNKYERRA